MIAPFLFAATLISGIAFANEGGHKCIEAQGIKPCVERMIENGKQDFKVNE